MNNGRRFTLSTSQKAILGVGAVVCAWQLLLEPAVFDAILSFFAAGAIPGTGIVLTPDKTLHLLLALAVSVAAIVLYRLFGRRTYVADAPQSAPLPITPHRPKQPVWLVRLARHVRAVGAPWIRRFSADTQRLLAWLGPKVMAVLRLLRRTAVSLGNSTVGVVIWIIAIESAVLMWVWHWLEPDIRRFDRWLEHRMRQSPVAAVLLDIGHTSITSMRDAWARIRIGFRFWRE